MDEFFKQVADAARSHLYFLALSGALVIPDMCAALESTDGETRGSRYIDWVDRNVAPRHISHWTGQPFLDGDSCYRFRCSLLHQGRTEHPKSRYSRIIFVEPGATKSSFHMNVIDDVLNIDVYKFCMEMVDSAFIWRTSKMGTEPYETNVQRFVTRYPNGLAPYIVGLPVIS